MARSRRSSPEIPLDTDAAESLPLLPASPAEDYESGDYESGDDQAGDDGCEPFVMDDGVVRRLHFGVDYVQSEMSVDDPYALSLQYTRSMMAFLLFLPKPKHVAIVGLGGGSMTKFCFRYLPRARITNLEIDARVIGMARLFEVPPPDARLRFVHADAGQWFASRASSRPDLDVVLLDGYDDQGIASAFDDRDFYPSVRARLRDGGMLVANVLGPMAVALRHQTRIAECFDGQTIVERVISDGNHLVFAFTTPLERIDWMAISREAKKFAPRYGLDFPAFARKLRRCHQRQHPQAG